jgi:hypothetical protein
VRWDGKYVAVGDQRCDDESTSCVYQTTGSGGKIVGKTSLTGAQDVVGFWIRKKVLIGGDAGLNEVELYPYPGGGPPKQTLGGFDGPYGVAVSE